jgi:hypothetical protein
LVALAGVAPHDAPHGGVGFQRGRIDRDAPVLQQPGRGQPFLDPGEDGSMRLEVDESPRPGDRRTIRRRRLQAQGWASSSGATTPEGVFPSITPTGTTMTTPTL